MREIAFPNAELQAPPMPPDVPLGGFAVPQKGLLYRVYV
jgi:hypothetical protein